jgi:hypothetical protein
MREKKLKSTNKQAFMKSAFESLAGRQLETTFLLEKCNLFVLENVIGCC